MRYDCSITNYVFVNMQGDLFVEWFPKNDFKKGQIIYINRYVKGKFVGCRDILECLGEL